MQSIFDKAIVRLLAIPFAGLVLSKGILSALHQLEIFPEKFVGRMMLPIIEGILHIFGAHTEQHEYSSIEQIAQWIVIMLFALIFWLVADFFAYRNGAEKTRQLIDNLKRGKGKARMGTGIFFVFLGLGFLAVGVTLIVQNNASAHKESNKLDQPVSAVEIQNDTEGADKQENRAFTSKDAVGIRFESDDGTPITDGVLENVTIENQPDGGVVANKAQISAKGVKVLAPNVPSEALQGTAGFKLTDSGDSDLSDSESTGYDTGYDLTRSPGTNLKGAKANSGEQKDHPQLSDDDSEEK